MNLTWGWTVETASEVLMEDPNFNIWNIVKPFYWIMKFFGLASFTIVGDVRDGKIKTRLRDVLHMLVVLTSQVYIVYINVIYDMSLSRTNSILIDIGAHFVEIFNGFNVLLGTLIYAVFRKKIWGIFRTCHEFDGEVNQTFY